MTDTDTKGYTMDHRSEELRVYSNGHKIHRRVFEKIEDPDYNEGYYVGYYYQEWTKLTAQCFLTILDGEVIGVSALDLAHSCAECDEWVSLEYRDGAAYMKGEPCALQNGLTTVVEIDVPSGRLICDDDLRDAEGMDVDIDGEGVASYNSTLGQAQVVEASAKVGLAYGPCLNTSPSLYEIEPGKYVVANPSYDEDMDEMGEPTFGGKAVAGFCTDLWAFSMADYDAFLAAGGPRIEDEDMNGTRSVIDVPAGRYRMTYHVGEKGFDPHGSGELIFAEFERIGDC